MSADKKVSCSVRVLLRMGMPQEEENAPSYIRDIFDPPSLR